MARREAVGRGPLGGRRGRGRAWEGVRETGGGILGIVAERGRPKFLRDGIAALTQLASAFDEAEIGVSDEAAAEFFDALNKLTVRAETSLPARPHPEQDPLQRSRRELEIERSLRITQHSVDSAPIAIFRLDSDGRVVAANEAACRSLGYSEQELTALTIFDIDPNFTPEAWRAHRAVTQVSGGRTLQSAHRRKDGSVFPIEVTVRQLLFDGALYSVSFVRDISERVQAETERRRLEERMLEAQKLESLGILAGGIAHDFNNLLMVILGNIDLIRCGGGFPPETESQLVDVDAAARQAADLCRQLLIYAGKGERVRQPVSVSALLREQAQMLEVSASKAVKLNFAIAEGLPELAGDPSQLRQVFLNLIINASEAIEGPKGEITLETELAVFGAEELAALHLSAPLEPGPHVVVRVTDTGRGMTEAVRSRIFDPFFSTKTTGRGLGLAAVRGIVHSHGGAIAVRSEVGRGTTFRLHFPVAEGHVAAAPPATRLRPDWRGEGLVLLVDDELALRELGAQMIQRLGLDVVTAKNGREAVALYRELRERISCVVLDWIMPEMGGAETLRELGAIAPGVRVIVASGHAPGDIASHLRNQEIVALLRKPFDLGELGRVLQVATSGRADGRR